jgi:DNA-binding transcriptional regulator/RsmH inhibitor MraZ
MVLKDCITIVLNEKTYIEKHKELIGLANSIDVWKQASLTKDQQKQMDDLTIELQAKTFELECQLLEHKIYIFQLMLGILKK